MMDKAFSESEARVRACLRALYPDDPTTARVAVDAVYKTGYPAVHVLAGDIERLVKGWGLLSRKEKSAAKLAQYAATVATIFP